MDEEQKKPSAIDNALADIARVAFLDPAICTGWVLVAEWTDGTADGFWTTTLADDQQPDWRQKGLLHHALETWGEDNLFDDDDDGDGIELEPVAGDYGWLMDPLCDVFNQIAGVVSAALGQRAGTEIGKPPDLVIVVVVSAADEERVVHAATVTMKDACASYGSNVDIGTIRRDEFNPWTFLPRFYTRSGNISEEIIPSFH